MRKLTESDFLNIIGTVQEGYKILDVRVKAGPFTDSDHYGIILARSNKNHYVTWQFHLGENEKPDIYWGHYFSEDEEAALKDFNIRDLSELKEKRYKVYGQTIVSVTTEVIAASLKEALKVAYDELNALTQYVGNGDSDKLIGVDGEYEAVSADDEIQWLRAEELKEDIFD